jgi:hypothetical protein
MKFVDELRDPEIITKTSEEICRLADPSCQAQGPVSSVQLFCCAECGTPTSEIVQGKEIEVVALEIQEWAHNLA